MFQLLKLEPKIKKKELSHCEKNIVKTLICLRITLNKNK